MLQFLKHLEVDRHDGVHTRNQRLAAIHMFFGYLAGRLPEMLDVGQRVAAIPTKRAAPPETRYLERDEVATLFAQLPARGRRALRDRVLLLLLYNTGARVQEVADLRVEHLDLRRPPRVRLHGKGDKWRTCPLWDETARELARLLADTPARASGGDAMMTAPLGPHLHAFFVDYLVTQKGLRVTSIRCITPERASRRWLICASSTST